MEFLKQVWGRKNSRTLVVSLMAAFTTFALGLALNACSGNGEGTFSSSAGKSQDSKGSLNSLSKTESNNSVRTHIPGLPALGHPNYPDTSVTTTVTVSGQVILQPATSSTTGRGTRAAVLQGGSVVGTTLDGTVLGAATTDANGFYSLDLPEGADNVFVTATDGSTIVLKAAVARLPDDNVTVDASSSTVGTYAEGEIGNVGTTIDFDTLVDTLKTQAERDTSLINEMATVQQGIIDDLLATNGRRVAKLNLDNSMNHSLFVRVAQSVIGFLSDTLVQPITAQADVSGNGTGTANISGAPTTFDKMKLFISGDLTGDEIVEGVARRLNINRDRVTSAGSLTSNLASALAKLEQNKSSLTPAQQDAIAKAIAAGIDAANVTDDDDDALTTVAFFSFLNDTIDSVVKANQTGDATDQKIADVLLNTTSNLTNTLTNAVNLSQQNQVLLSQQLDFGTLVGDIANQVSNGLVNAGVDHDTSSNLLTNLLTDIALDLVDTTPGNATTVFNTFLDHVASGINAEFIDILTDIETTVRPHITELEEENHLFNTIFTSTTTTIRATSTTRRSSTTTTRRTTVPGYYYRGGDTESRILEFFNLW